jgi:hypothetical protein
MAQPRRAHVTSSSKIASSDNPLERQPMRDISNKLHALVDEFVSNLSSECDSLVNNISSQASKYAPHASGAEVAKAPRSSNRNTSEVLNGLRRPAGNHFTDKHHQEGKSHVEQEKLKSTSGSTIQISDSRFVRRMRDTELSSALLEGTDTPNDLTSPEIGSKYTLSRDETLRGHGKADTATIGKIMHAIEILSSDQSFDDCLLTSMKSTKTKKVKHNSTSIRNSRSRGRPTGVDTKSPSVSRESSHLMNYNYEEDTNSLGGRSQDIETPFVKLSWPNNEWEDHEGGIGMKIESHSAPSSNETHKKSGRKQGDEEN